MGRIILCTSKQAEVPYVFPVSEAKVYTIEELCYYIYHNIYEVTIECFDEKLVGWLSDELGMVTIAKKLKDMIESNSGLKDRIISIMCSCDYYTEKDIKALLNIISEMDNMSYQGRMKRKGDHFLKYGKYSLAKRQYDKIINSGFSVNLSPQEYGNILHNRSMACFYTGAYTEAIQGFKEAYNRNNNKKSLEHYLYALLLNSNREQFENEALRYGLSDNDKLRISSGISEAFVKASESAEYNELLKKKKYGNGNEAFDYAAEKLDVWKKQYREANS